MYFTTYRSPLLIVILNTIIISWCILANFHVGVELLNVIYSIRVLMMVGIKYHLHHLRRLFA